MESSKFRRITRKFNRLENSLKENKLLQKINIIDMVKDTRANKIKMPNHIHLYRRIDLVPKWKQINDPKKNQPFLVLQCQKPTCRHYIRLEQAIGMLNECNVCHNPFILDKETVTKAKPRCRDCIKRRVKPEINAIEELLKDI